MGKNKLRKFAEMATFENVHEVNYGEKLELRFPNGNPIIVELGCGRGEYTVELARKYRDRNFVGIDIKGARMYTGAKMAREEKLENVVFVRSHIEFINSLFQADTIDEIWLTFPDPQMKKVRKRLVGTRLLETYQQCLKNNGLIHLKTDSDFLYTYTCEMLKINELAIVKQHRDLYAEAHDELLDVKTYYEKKWLESGKTIKYICFALPKGKKLVEPEVEIEKDDYHSVGRGVKNY